MTFPTWLQPSHPKVRAVAVRSNTLEPPRTKAERDAIRMRALNADPEFKAKSAAAASERMKQMNTDPAFRAKVDPLSSARLAQQNRAPEARKRSGNLLRTLWDDPEFVARHRERSSQRMRERHAAQRAKP